MNDLPVVTTIEELVGLVELIDVRFFELSGVVDRTAIGGGPEVSSESQSPIQLQLGQSEDRQQIGVTVRLEANTDVAAFVVEVAAEYKCSQPIELSEEVKGDFASKVGFMNLVPFLREGLVTTAARLRVNPPMIPLIRPEGHVVAGLAEGMKGPATTSD